ELVYSVFATFDPIRDENGRTSSRAGASRSERLEPQEPVYWLARRRSERTRRGGSARGRAQTQGAGTKVRHCLHIGARTGEAHTRHNARETRPTGTAGATRPSAERARLRRTRRAQQGRRERALGRAAGASVAAVV